MALISPGISVTVNDQSQYVNSAVGSVPLVILATQQDKYYNGVLASGTTAAMAGKLLTFTSQRDLITQMGTPAFQLSASGTVVNASEISEYGLLAAYSALGLSNQLYAIRADVDLAQLRGTSVRPIGAPTDGTYWLDTNNTEFGLYELNATTSSFGHINPLIITNPAQVSNDPAYAYAVPTPIASVGQVGDYALVFTNIAGATPAVANTIRLFYKAGEDSVGLNNTWVQVGSPTWQTSRPTLTGSLTPVFVASTTYTVTINGVAVSFTGGTTAAQFATAINSAAIPGVTAQASSTGRLQFFVTSAADSTNTFSGTGRPDGKLLLADGTATPFALCGITAGTYYPPYLFYGTYAQRPSGGWYSTDSQPRPTGSIWWKTSAIGGGLNFSMSKFDAASGSFMPLTVQAFSTIGAQIFAQDRTGGGTNITHGTVSALYNVSDTTSNSLRFNYQKSATVATAVGGTTGALTAGNQFAIVASRPGTSTLTTYTITVSNPTGGPTLTSLVSDILAKNIPYVTAELSSSNKVVITHKTGGHITMYNVSGTPLTAAGFGPSTGGTGFVYNSVLGQIYINNNVALTTDINYGGTRPYTKPATGTYWYYSNPADIDIMVNDGTGWKGYRNVAADIRGYNLQGTDPGGVIVSSTQPSSRSDALAPVSGDLWLDTSDLVNYPALYRYSGSDWVAIDNTDHTSSNGIIFGDARWDSTGTTDVVSGTLPATTTLLTSNYVDLDCPDYRLYPPGVLLFNTRRSGYSVKKFVPDYFNALSFPAQTLPTVKDAWVTASGLDNEGVMKAGPESQRSIVVGAMQAALDSNLDILSPVYQFNLVAAPGYPELIKNMITLNDNRGATAFIIGDTPMTLEPNATAINRWVNNTDGKGYDSDPSPYVGLYYPSGRTNDLNGNTVAVPPSHAVLRSFLYNDQISYPWFAPAGVTRGRVSNLSDIGHVDANSGLFIHNSVGQGTRDMLFQQNINPITSLPGVGFTIFGQLTRLGANTSRNRVNVVRLENYLRTIFASVANGYLFEPNDNVTRRSIQRQIESSLNNVLANRGLYDYLVICDTSNNTSTTIANSQLYVDVAIEPMRGVEFIYIPIAIYNPGAIAALASA